MPGGPLTDLREYLRALEGRGDLAVVDAEVDPILELPEIHRRVIAAGGPALLFRRVKDSPFSVVSNLFGTATRVATAFGSRARELVEELAKAPEELLPPSPGRLWKKRGLLLSLARVGLRRGRRGSVLEAGGTAVDLGRIPFTKSWEQDGGAFGTLGLTYTCHPATGGANLGLYRLQRYDPRTLGMHWQIGKGGGFHHAAAEARNEALPVNVFFGGPPAALLGALAPLPENVPELLLASLVLGRRLRLARNPAGPLPLLADAEFALVGRVPPHERRPEGPFGDHYGYYSLTHDFPYLEVDAVYHRRDAILPVTVVGKPRQEDFFLGDFLQDLLSPLFPVVMPGVIDLWSYGETGYHALSAAVVRERYKREAMVSAFRILGEGQLSLTKFLLLLDRPCDLKDFPAVLTRVLQRADFRTDLYVMGNLSMDTLDYAGPRINEGSKGVLLGIGDPIRSLPQDYVGSPPPEVSDVRMFCPGCLVVQGPSFEDAPGAPGAIASLEAFKDWPLIVLVDDARQAARSSMNFLWTTFTRFNPANDIHARATRLFHTHVGFDPPLVIDSRKKPHYPVELFCDETTLARVDRRWTEYFPSGMTAGDSASAHLD
jgi:UbiD family decarboxylase